MRHQLWLADASLGVIGHTLLNPSIHEFAFKFTRIEFSKLLRRQRTKGAIKLTDLTPEIVDDVDGEISPAVPVN